VGIVQQPGINIGNLEKKLQLIFIANLFLLNWVYVIIEEFKMQRLVD